MYNMKKTEQNSNQTSKRASHWKAKEGQNITRKQFFFYNFPSTAHFNKTKEDFKEKMLSFEQKCFPFLDTPHSCPIHFASSLFFQVIFSSTICFKNRWATRMNTRYLLWWHESPWQLRQFLHLKYYRPTSLSTCVRLQKMVKSETFTCMLPYFLNAFVSTCTCNVHV